MPSHPAQLTDLQEKSRVGLQFLLNQMFVNADQALLGMAGRAASNAEQNLYFESMRELRRKRRGIEKFFFAAIAARLADPRQGSTIAPLDEQLALVGTETLEDTLAIDTVATRAEEACGETLVELGKRLSALLGWRGLSVEDNPLGPRVLCSLFLEVCSQLEVGAQSKRVFSRLFERFVINDLAPFYAQMLEWLPKAKPRAVVDEPDIEEIAAPAATALEPVGPVTVDMPKGAVGSSWDPRSTPLLAPAGKARALPRSLLDELLQSIQRRLNAPADLAKALPGHDPARTLPVHRLLNQELEALQYDEPQALPQDDAETIDRIAALFGQLLSSPQVPVAVRPLLALMQVPVLRQALFDEDLMRRADHPVRQILNEVAGLCLGWTPREPVEEDAIYRRLGDMVDGIVGNFARDLEAFETELQSLQAWIKAEQSMARLVAQRTIHAETGRAGAAAARQRVRGLIADEISGVDVPPDLQEFLEGPWSDVLFVIVLQDGEESDAWLAAQQTTHNLVQGLQEDAADATEALAQAPATLRAVRRGLERIRHGRERAEELLASMEKRHLELYGERARQQPDHVDPALAAAEGLDVDAASIPKSILDKVDRMPPDTWVEFRNGRYQGSARLLTRIPVTGKLLFVNRAGVKIAEWQRLEFAAALQKGKVTILGGTRLFDKAIRSLGSRRP